MKIIKYQFLNYKFNNLDNCNDNNKSVTFFKRSILGSSSRAVKKVL
jgi:hypothetical protein